MQPATNTTLDFILSGLFIGNWIQAAVTYFKPGTLTQSIGAKFAMSVGYNLLGLAIFALLAKSVGADHKNILVWSVYIITAIITIIAIVVMIKPRSERG